ncbi:MAG: xanthine dehydrogenase family protein molybdopterin-binding subunit [Rhizobiaceae bacterium]|nr:xanthine dehydrogenase family protein molybdopterin-binding subunit [Rhizobiaceae bacterium]
MNIRKIARRTFLIGATAIAGGLAVGYYYVRKPYPNPLEDELSEGEVTFNPYVKIAPDNTITIITARAEMGQGVQTTLAAMVAEELDVTLDQIKVEHGPADWTYFNSAMMEDASPFPFLDESFMAEATRSMMPPIAKLLGIQATGGSSSMKDGYDKMRQSGCAARLLLIAAASQELGIDAAGLKTENGSIIDPASGQSMTYGELAAKAATLEPPSKLVLRKKSDWKLLGKSQRRTDIPAKVTGQPIYGIDVDLPEMIYGTVKMSPRFGANAIFHDDKAALAVPGVTAVIPLETPAGSGFGIIAENTWAAFKGAEALEVKWGKADHPPEDEGIYALFDKALSSTPHNIMRNDGNAETVFADAPREVILSAEYRVPWLAHACMEPMNATARWKDGVLDIWAPNQAPTLIQMTVSGLVGVASEDVNVHITTLGGGFGRRLEMDFVQYAVEMAKHTEGKPIKVTWTREEDTSHDVYRPAAKTKLRALLNPGTIPTALDIHLATPSIIKSFMGRTFPMLSPAGPDRTMVDGLFDQPYTIENYRVSTSKVDVNIPVGFWRSVGASHTAYVHECFLDEIAEKSKMDPLAMRLELAKEYPAALGVLNKVAEMCVWDNKFAKNSTRGRGLALSLSFGTWVAEVVQVNATEDGIVIENVWCATEIGEALDPDNVKAQMMSGIIFGLSAAMGQEITFSDGMVEQQNFDGFDVMRMHQCPTIEVEILETYHKMGGAGEPGTPPAAPALANAIYAATGKRIRALPLSSETDFA